MEASSLQKLPISAELFVDRSTTVIGGTASGKSTIVVDFLYYIQPFVGQIVVFSPTDRQNHTYDSGIVPLPCIHYDITQEKLEKIWRRQEALVAVHTRATNISILESLFKLIPAEKTNIARAAIAAANDTLAKYKVEISTAEMDQVAAEKCIKTMTTKCTEFKIMAYKQSITVYRGLLENMNLSPDAKFALKYFDINPRLVMIFDDCTDILAKLARSSIISRLWYQGRHQKITIIVACHTDTVLLPAIKKNTHVTIFSDEKTACAYIGRPTNDFDKESKNKAMIACKSAFTPVEKYQKLVLWGGVFYRYTATQRSEFQFGCTPFRDYCNKIKIQEGKIASNNEYMSNFR